MQEGEARREQLLQMLRDSTVPISGSALARSLDVIIEHEIYGQITDNLIVKKVTLFAHKVNLFIWQILTRHMYIQGVFLCQQLKSF